MALPHTPKTDWAAADGVTEANLNEIGENLEYIDSQILRRRFSLSGFLPLGTSFAIAEDISVTSISVVLPASTRLMLRGIRYFTGSLAATHDFRVEVAATAFPVVGIGDDISDYADYIGSDDGYDDTTFPDGGTEVRLCQNITASADFVLISVFFTNLTGGVTNIGLNGVHLNFEIQDL